MFEDTFKGSLKDYVGSHVLERASTVEMDYMLQGMLFLTVDISKITPSLSDANGIVHMFRRQLRMSALNGELMPVNRFLEIYYRFGLAERQAYEDPGARLKHLHHCITLMIKFFHKSKPSADMAGALMAQVESHRQFSKVLAEFASQAK